MPAKPCSNKPHRQCSKCGMLTDGVGYDPVTGAVGIPLCPRCADSGVARLCVLLATFTAVMVWML